MCPELAAPAALEFEALKQILPQRYPFLMLDRVVDLEPGVRAVGVKNLTGNEWFFQGHFPLRAVTPGVLLAEAAAQTGIVFFHATHPPATDEPRLYLLGRLAMRFLTPVVPGDQLRIEVTPITVMTHAAMLAARLTVEGGLVATGEVSLSVRSVTDA